ncbi:J domain-containing protein [Streptomyces sp. NPDC047072]|uniref:J domain-containing protein n=1 Tax=Streptomyces sp. NPDC047072 TaxID=3154809 RepID=UPI0034076B2C
MRATQHDWYAVLGVPPEASQQAITRRYREQLRRLHPDVRPANEQAKANDDVALLNLAYETLSDEHKRRDYDRNRQRTGAPPPAPSPPPAPPDIFVEPASVELGAVQVGQSPQDQRLAIRLSDGSVIAGCEPLTAAGTGWTVEVERGMGPILVVWLRGRPVAPTAVTGPQVDELRLLIQQAEVVVSVTMVVEVQHQAVQPRRRRHAAALVVVLLCALVGLAVVHGQPGADSTSTKPYCVLSTEAGKTLSFFRTHSGTAERTGPVVWAMRVGNTSRDRFVYWWTPQFPYWERANVQPGLVRDSWTYGRYEYVEVLVDKNRGWKPLDGLFEREPQLDSVAERDQREHFLTGWIGDLDVPQCTVATGETKLAPRGPAKLHDE